MFSKIPALIYSNLTFVSLVGESVSLVLLFVIFILLKLIYYRKIKETYLFILSLLSYPLSVVIKLLLKIPRPENSPYAGKYTWDVYGFPSSHTFYYTAVLGYLLYLVFKLKDLNKVFRVISAGISIYLLTLVGISRVYLGFHSVRDVVGGYLMGGFFLLFIIVIDKSWVRK